MAELLFWQANGYMDSCNTAVYVAISVKQMGVDAAILFDEAAIAAYANKKFEISPNLVKHAKTIEDNVKKLGMSMDPMEVLKQAKSAGVALMACGGWCDFLGLRGKLPPEIQVIEMPEAFKLVAESKRIIGGP